MKVGLSKKGIIGAFLAVVCVCVPADAASHRVKVQPGGGVSNASDGELTFRYRGVLRTIGESVSYKEWDIYAGPYGGVRLYSQSLLDHYAAFLGGPEIVATIESPDFGETFYFGETIEYSWQSGVSEDTGGISTQSILSFEGPYWQQQWPRAGGAPGSSDIQTRVSSFVLPPPGATEDYSKWKKLGAQELANFYRHEPIEPYQDFDDFDASSSSGEFEIVLTSSRSAEEAQDVEGQFLVVEQSGDATTYPAQTIVRPLSHTFHFAAGQTHSDVFPVNETFTITIPASVAPGEEFTAVIKLIPFEIVSDLNNNGKIDGGDRTLKTDGAKTSATDAQKEKATEYLFANDTLSNGAWDKEDTDSSKPASATDDDDAEEISVTCAATWGAVWFEHPAIDKLSFYKTKECVPADKVTFPFALSTEETGKLPEKLYVRLDGADFTAQAEGDLVMKFGKADQLETWAEDKLKFTAVKQLGDEKFFQAARDYIFEKNTELFAQNWGYPVASPTTYIRMCVMREEATAMSPYESYWNDAKVHYHEADPSETSPFDPVQHAIGLGISGVMNVDPEMTVVINGNQCSFSIYATDLEATATAIIYYNNGEPLMTDKCQGRLVIGGVLNPASNDHYDPNTSAPGMAMRGSYLAGPDPIPETGGPGGKYMAQTGQQFVTGAGRLPTSVDNGIGGLSTSYNLAERSGYPNSMIGYAPMKNDGKGAVFVACGLNFTQGKGKVAEFYQAAKDSKVPDIDGATPSNGMTIINLFLLDSGATSPALAHKAPSGDLKLILKGSKHDGYAYYPSSFLRFKATKPREQ